VIELNTPYLLTVTKNADVMKIFVDGVPFATKTGVPSLGITNHKMYLGYNFLGVLDEVAIYSKPIARTEILDQVASLSLRIFFFLLFFFFLSFFSFSFSFLFYKKNSKYQLISSF